MEKPTDKALDLFEAGLVDDPRVERKKMFGTPAAFVNGHLFYGVFTHGIVARVGASRRDELCAEPGIEPFGPMPERPWKEYIHIDAETWDADAVRNWGMEALEFTAALPPKKKASKNKG